MRTAPPTSDATMPYSRVSLLPRVLTTVPGEKLDNQPMKSVSHAAFSWRSTEPSNLTEAFAYRSFSDPRG